MSVELNNDQVYAIYDLDRWWKSSTSDQLFQITGGPGTGKTYLIRYFIERMGLSYDEVLFVAYMGKAASILARNGLPAKTIHSAIYDYEKVIARDENGKMIFLNNGKPKMVSKFVKKDRIGKKIKLIVVDEGSMVEERIALDLMSYGVPIIVLGDLNQLPPVFGKPFFLQTPDVTLTQIMRQKEGDPIIWLSREALAGRPLKPGVYKNSAVIEKKDINEYIFRNADIALTGTNRLRYNINNYYREELKQIKNLQYPHIGEKIICRKNNWNKSIGDGIYLTNGMTGFVDDVYRDSYNGKTMTIDFRPDFIKKAFRNVTFSYPHLYEIPGKQEEQETENFVDKFNDKIEFAYAITTHSCLSLDTMIYTEDGIQTLGDLDSYTGKVYNGTNWEKPSKYIDNGFDTINKVITVTGLEYDVTDYHKCKVLTENGIETIYGKDLKVGDALLLRKNQKLYDDYQYKTSVEKRVNILLSKMDGIFYNSKNINEIELPNYIFNVSLSEQRAFLYELFNSMNKDEISNILSSLNITDRVLRKQLSVLLLNLGINPVFNKKDDSNKELADIISKSWKGELPETVKKICEERVLTIDLWNEIKDNNMDGEINQFITDILNDFFIVHIESIDHYKGLTACLEMPQSHVFLQDGFLGGNSQGSQWDNVLFLKEDFMWDPEDQRKFNYTAITRAAKQITIVI